MSVYAYPARVFQAKDSIGHRDQLTKRRASMENSIVLKLEVIVCTSSAKNGGVSRSSYRRVEHLDKRDNSSELRDEPLVVVVADRAFGEGARRLCVCVA